MHKYVNANYMYWSASSAKVGGDIAHGDWYRKSRDLVTLRHFRHASYIVWNVYQTFLFYKTIWFNEINMSKAHPPELKK